MWFFKAIKSTVNQKSMWSMISDRNTLFTWLRKSETFSLIKTRFISIIYQVNDSDNNVVSKIVFNPRKILYLILSTFLFSYVVRYFYEQIDKTSCNSSVWRVNICVDLFALSTTTSRSSIWQNHSNCILISVLHMRYWKNWINQNSNFYRSKTMDHLFWLWHCKLWIPALYVYTYT